MVLSYLILSFGLFSYSASSAVVNVGPSSNYTTIQAGLDAALDGDIIQLEVRSSLSLIPLPTHTIHYRRWDICFGGLLKNDYSIGLLLIDILIILFCYSILSSIIYTECNLQWSQQYRHLPH